jgi:dihydrofolate reductase
VKCGSCRIDAAKKYVVSSTPDRVDWNAELVRGDLAKAIQQLKQEPGKGLLVGGAKLPLAENIVPPAHNHQ